MVIYFILVLRERLELSRLAAIDPKSTVTTNSTTQAFYFFFTFILYENINLNPTFFYFFLRCRRDSNSHTRLLQGRTLPVRHSTLFT